MQKFALVLAVVLSTAGLASGEIVVTAPTMSMPNSSASGSMTLTVAFSGSYDVAAYDVDLRVIGRDGATGLTFTGAAAAANYLFSQPSDGFHIQTHTAGELFGQDHLLSGTELLADVSRNLVTVNLAIAPGTEGVFDVTVSRDDGFNNGTADFPDQTFINGVVTVTPEPATMGLLVAGALALVARRRR